jgi:hypothetical protein
MVSTNRNPTFVKLASGWITAVAFLGLAVPQVAAGPLFCSAGLPSSGPGFHCETDTEEYTAGNTSNSFDFDPYPDGFSFTNLLSFDSILRTFTLAMSAIFIDPEDPVDAAALLLMTGGATPATYLTTQGAAWIYFYVEDLQVNDCGPPVGTPGECGPPQQGREYEGAWTQTITWFAFGDPPGSVRVLHDPRGGEAFFGNDITVDGSYEQFVDPCGENSDCDPPEPGECCIDPRIDGQANDFSSTITTVPEPASLWLLGLGGAGLVARARRRREQRRQHRQRRFTETL